MGFGNGWNATRYDSSFSFVADYGDEVLQQLHARSGRRILDLGCGTGVHALTLTSQGVEVVGVDVSEEMLAAARRRVPGAQFMRLDATFDEPPRGPFDAVFSNAALHWMQPQDRALSFARGPLKRGGRFVAEMGGHGNVAEILRCFHRALVETGLDGQDDQTNWFPSVDQQTSLLESAGFEVEAAELFDRPTPLGGGLTPADWCANFRATTWAKIPAELVAEVRSRIDDLAKPRLWQSEGWFADYRRLRFVAVAV